MNETKHTQRTVKLRGLATCPKGHRAPRVQYLADEEVYCCTTCAITWKAIYEITIPAEMSFEKWAQMAMAAPDMLTALKAFSGLGAIIGRSSRPSWWTDDDAWTEYVNADELRIAAIAKAGTQ